MRGPLVMLLVALLVTGCASSISVREIDDAAWFSRESRNALETGAPSERTRQFLRREGLADQLYHDSDAVLLRMHERLLETHARVIALHLAELCYLSSGDRGNDDAATLRYLLSATEYAYSYLFDADLLPAPDPYDPGFRWACDFYNRSLADVVRLERTRRPLKSGAAHKPVLEGTLEMVRGTSEYGWDSIGSGEVLVAFDYDVVGLPGRVRAFGLGVPVIFVRDPAGSSGRLEPGVFHGTDGPGVSEVHLQQSFGATMIAHFAGTLCSSRAAHAPRRVACEIYDPSRTDEFTTAGRRVPLEADLTTPLAYALARS